MIIDKQRKLCEVFASTTKILFFFKLMLAEVDRKVSSPHEKEIRGFTWPSMRKAKTQGLVNFVLLSTKKAIFS